MNKKLFIVLVLLMSLALIGIIFVQAYYINNAVKNEQQRFTSNVKNVLKDVVSTIEKQEFEDFVYIIQPLIENGVKVDSSIVRSLYVTQENLNTNELIIYRNGILEENYKLSSSLFDIGLDSITIKRIINERQSKVFIQNTLESASKKDLNDLFSQLGQRTLVDKIMYETTYNDLSDLTPIYKRISVDQLQSLLKERLQNENINIDFEFAIYSNRLATKVHSPGFDLKTAQTISEPIFNTENSKRNYQLLINFPERTRFVLSSIIGIMALSLLFTSVIIIAYVSTVYQLIKQRKVDVIKTDFINNMTHEFKTPIATINLAIDAIKNPLVIADKEKVMSYLKMIKDENKRMHAQVENVLRISKLERNELNISKEHVALHDLIEDAITHVQLIIEDRQGTIQTHIEAKNDTVLANDIHFTNVIVNILDNAIKYSPNAPKIDVYTENAGNNIILKIKDQGSGMSKTAQKHIFEKFYREHTGNIHNVKGHGLGLAYVKRIVTDHHGHVTVDSEKDKGSTFTITLPLIS